MKTLTLFMLFGALTASICTPCFAAGQNSGKGPTPFIQTQIDENLSCASKDDCASMDCSQFDTAVKSGFKPDCISYQCQCV